MLSLMNYTGAGSDACHFTLWGPVYTPVVLLNLNCSKRIFPTDEIKKTKLKLHFLLRMDTREIFTTPQV